MTRHLLLMVALCATPALSQEPAPKTAHLLYELPASAVQRARAARPEVTIDDLMAASLVSLEKRLGGLVTIARDTGTRFTVDFQGASTTKIDYVRRHVELAGKMEIRLIASPTYDADGIKFDLTAENARVVAWLDAGGRDRLQADPAALDAFYQSDAEGPVAGANLRWFVRPVAPAEGAQERWGVRLQDFAQLAPAAVAAYPAADWNDGVIPASWLEKPAAQRRLPELVALNMHGGAFTNADLALARTKVVTSIRGAYGLRYELKSDRAEAYGDWSEKHLGSYAAILFDDEVVATPRFAGRVAATGTVPALGKRRAEAFAVAMRAQLPGKPRLLQMTTN